MTRNLHGKVLRPTPYICGAAHLEANITKDLVRSTRRQNRKRKSQRLMEAPKKPKLSSATEPEDGRKLARNPMLLVSKRERKLKRKKEASRHPGTTFQITTSFSQTAPKG